MQEGDGFSAENAYCFVKMNGLAKVRLDSSDFCGKHPPPVSKLVTIRRFHGVSPSYTLKQNLTK